MGLLYKARSLQQWLSPSGKYQSHPAGSLKHSSLGSTPEGLISRVWGGTFEGAFVTSPQGKQVLLAPGPHLENHWLGALSTCLRVTVVRTLELMRPGAQLAGFLMVPGC